jgi:hypothetical protein
MRGGAVEFTMASQSIVMMPGLVRNEGSPLTDIVFPAQAVARRRKLLLGVPFGIVALQGCGGGGSASAATVSSPAPAPAANTPVASANAIGGWADRPAASASTGQTIFVPDVGSTGSLWVSNGRAWIPASNPLTLAYVLGPMSGLRITAAYSFPGGGSGNKAPQVKAYFGLATYASNATALLDTRGQFGSQQSVLLEVTLQNRNAMASNQTWPIDYAPGASGNAFTTTAVDFTQDVTIGLGALNNSASTSPADKQVLDWFSVEMLA